MLLLQKDVMRLAFRWERVAPDALPSLCDDSQFPMSTQQSPSTFVEDVVERVYIPKPGTRMAAFSKGLSLTCCSPASSAIIVTTTRPGRKAARTLLISDV